MVCRSANRTRSYRVSFCIVRIPRPRPSECVEHVLRAAVDRRHDLGPAKSDLSQQRPINQNSQFARKTDKLDASCPMFKLVRFGISQALDAPREKLAPLIVSHNFFSKFGRKIRDKGLNALRERQPRQM